MNFAEFLTTQNIALVLVFIAAVYSIYGYYQGKK